MNISQNQNFPYYPENLNQTTKSPPQTEQTTENQILSLLNNLDKFKNVDLASALMSSGLFKNLGQNNVFSMAINNLLQNNTKSKTNSVNEEVPFEEL